jgi:hypothetical protein
MIFRQYEEILRGEKTQTRRLHTPRVKVGRTYAAVPKRGHPAHWFRQIHITTTRIENPREYVCMANVWEYDNLTAAQANRWLAKNNGIQFRIEIVDIRREPLNLITPEDALAEGVGSIEEYAVLWNTINRKPGTRWEDHPDVCVITFKLADGVAEAYQRWRFNL